MKQQIRFCRSFDGTRIAFAVSGNGPPLVRAPHWFTHLEHDWNNPAMMPWVAGLSRHYSLLRFDQRGTGLSDRDVPEISFESMVGDLASVVDAAGFGRFAILGLSQGASTAVAYASLHPERVSHLIICGGFVRGAEKRDPSPQNLERRRLQQGLIEMGWGSDDVSFRQVFSSQFMPDRAWIIRSYSRVPQGALRRCQESRRRLSRHSAGYAVERSGRATGLDMTAPSKRKTGRPRSEFDQKTADRICDQIIEGKSLRRICTEKWAPSKKIVLRWLKENAAFAAQYSRAREEQADGYADELMELGKQANSENAHAIRVRADIIKWVCSKLKPKRYGDRLALDVRVLQILTEIDEIA